MLNQVFLIGNLTRDPETRQTQSGLEVCSFTLAVNRKVKDKEEVLFIDVSCFGKTAEAVGKYHQRGSRALVQGRLVLNKWESDGQKHEKIKVVADFVRGLNAKKNEEAEPHNEEGEPF